MDADLHKTVRTMFELMYEANGIGLAANQVDLPYRLFIVNLAAKPDEGEECVFINPVLSQPRGGAEQEEGCLSLPGVYANVRRPEKIRLSAYSLDGSEIEADLDGLMARVVQHEADHLEGILFVDRLSVTSRLTVEAPLREFERDFQASRDRGTIADDDTVASRLHELESKYC